MKSDVENVAVATDQENGNLLILIYLFINW